MKELLIVGGAAVAVWYLFLRNPTPALAAGPGTAGNMPAGNAAAAYPGGYTPPPGPVYGGPNAVPPIASPPLNAPPQFGSPNRLFSFGSVTAAGGDLGSSIVPGSTVGTGSAPGYIAGRVLSMFSPGYRSVRMVPAQTGQVL